MKRSHPPNRDAIPDLQSFGVTLDEETLYYVDNPEALANSLGGNGTSGPTSSLASWLSALTAYRPQG